MRKKETGKRKKRKRYIGERKKQSEAKEKVAEMDTEMKE